ncbi:unnamed protein product [Miscanthus lutarioriparius]|uniref:Protein kinase domain-containing protein n=1 Tax=Miscanthus lutarioriparius TaxID=422564 RepID=A0A811QAA8_9POAL|nr:unnamed protein product [Miscanthus lutarioriparius]
MRPGGLPTQQPGTPGHARRRPDLTLPMPQREFTVSFAVPFPLPPVPASARCPTPPGIPVPAATAAQQQQQSPLLAELERVRRVGSGAGRTVWMHPAVVRCHGMYERGGELQILLEYMDGGSLDGRRIVAEPFLADVARQVLSGIAYLHRRHIVHHDIKPSNLLIDSACRVKIADFGVGRILNQTMDPSNSSVGTIAYMSPERINTDLNDGSYAGDIWSFGLSILEFYLDSQLRDSKPPDSHQIQNSYSHNSKPQDSHFTITSLKLTTQNTRTRDKRQDYIII